MTMPSALTYPGVYVEEIASGVRTITGVATSIAAFVGTAKRGPTDADGPVIINCFGDYERIFGGLSVDSTMSYAVRDFFLNGGSQAIIVRLINGGAPALISVPTGLTLAAKSPGEWGEKLRARVDYKTKNPADTSLYNLVVRDTGSGAEERYLNISTDPASPRSLNKLLAQSSLVTVSGAPPATRPTDHPAIPIGDPFANDSATPPTKYAQAGNEGDNGTAPTDTQYMG